jgi:pyruvate/2-oxoglutarate dehydrogenase complex dihydrolipoamide dehydrogenase (E3) component
MEQIRYQPDWHRKEIAQAGIDVRLGCEATAESVLGERPDIVVVATGARPNLPHIEGLPEALSRGDAVLIDDVLADQVELRKGPLVIWGASEGIELALDLKRAGRDVRVLDAKSAFVPAHYIGSRGRILTRWLAKAELAVECGAELASVEAGGLQLRRADGKSESIRSAQLIIAPGRIAHDPLSSALHGKEIVVQVLGDARQPRSYGNAIHEAAYLARRI